MNTSAVMTISRVAFLALAPVHASSWNICNAVGILMAFVILARIHCWKMKVAISRFQASYATAESGKWCLIVKHTAAFSRGLGAEIMN